MRLFAHKEIENFLVVEQNGVFYGFSHTPAEWHTVKEFEGDDMNKYLSMEEAPNLDEYEEILD